MSNRRRTQTRANDEEVARVRSGTDAGISASREARNLAAFLHRSFFTTANRFYRGEFQAELRSKKNQDHRQRDHLRRMILRADRATRRLLFALVRCRASYSFRYKGVVSRGLLRKAAASIHHGEPRLASPALVHGYVSKTVPQRKRRWLQRRNPRVVLFTFTHEVFGSPNSFEPYDMWRSMERLVTRWSGMNDFLLRHVGVGGVVHWEASSYWERKRPIAPSTQDKVVIHVHTLLEMRGNSLGSDSRAFEAVQREWKRSKQESESDDVRRRPFDDDNKDEADSEHLVSETLNGCLYVCGLPKLWKGERRKLVTCPDERSCKLLRPFIPPDEFIKPGTIERPSRNAPSTAALRLIVAFHAAPHKLGPLWIGLWDHNSNPGRALRGQDCAHKNDANFKFGKSFFMKRKVSGTGQREDVVMYKGKPRTVRKRVTESGIASLIRPRKKRRHM